MGMSLDFDVDLEKGMVDCDSVYTKSPDKPMSPDNKPVITDQKEKRKKSASKPPRPPRGPSLDAADQKLIREIAELAMLKRARVERMRALKKSRAAKAEAASSLGNVLATLFTAVFFFVLVLQGLSPRAVVSSGETPLVYAGKAKYGFVPVEFVGNPSASEPNGGYTEPVLAQRFTNLIKPVSGMANEKKDSR